MAEADPSSGFTPRRKAGRLRLRLRAHAILHSGSERVVLCDLSAGGAKVFCRAGLGPGRDLLLRWSGHEAFGTVVWERDGLRGVQFDEPLADDALGASRYLQDAGGMTRAEIEDWLADKGWGFGKALN